ncbi:hypothetical protein Sjap_012100 [Stephania japonica]|uniref:EF-hand domain-containing protein n=1 Tax=Stephania japonica TaxID=461633 RepID=A0AAP0NXA2_9MAGN
MADYLLKEILKFHGNITGRLQSNNDNINSSLGRTRERPISDAKEKEGSHQQHEFYCKHCCEYELGMPSEDDLQILLHKFGMNSCSTGDKGSENIESNISMCNRCWLLDGALLLLEAKEASVDELEAAFNIFDANRDGYVDARELQAVLCKLDFEQGKKLEDCEKMINAFDGNRDGRIDFAEFRNILENSN